MDNWFEAKKNQTQASSISDLTQLTRSAFTDLLQNVASNTDSEDEFAYLKSPPTHLRRLKIVPPPIRDHVTSLPSRYVS